METDVQAHEGSERENARTVVIYGKKKYDLKDDHPTGAELYALFGIPAGNKLFLETPSEKEPDKPVPNDATRIHVKNGTHFYDLPPGTVG